MNTTLSKLLQMVADCNITAKRGFIKNMTRLEIIILDVNNGCVIFASYAGCERIKVITVQDAPVFYFFLYKWPLTATILRNLKEKLRPPLTPFQ